MGLADRRPGRLARRRPRQHRGRRRRDRVHPSLRRAPDPRAAAWMAGTSPNGSPRCSTGIGASHDHPDPHPATAGRRAGGTAAADAAPAHPPRRPRGPGHREGAGIPPRSCGCCWSRRSPAGPVLVGHPPGPGGVPHGKTSEAWNEATSSIPAPTQAALRTLEWIGRAENLVVCGPAGTGKTFLLEALARPRSRPDATSPGSPSKPSASWSAATAPTTRSPKPSPDPARRSGDRRRYGCSRSAPTPPKGSTASSTPPTNAARSRCRRTCTRRASTSHAQDAGHRHRRPAPAPRSPVPDQRRKRATVPSPHRRRRRRLAGGAR